MWPLPGGGFAIPAALQGDVGGPVQALSVDNHYCIEAAGSPDIGRVAGSINLGKPVDMDFDPQTDNFTILGWIKRFEAGDFQRCIISKGFMDPGSGGDITLFIGVNDENKLYVLCGGGENTADDDALDETEWTFFAFTCSAGTGRLYKNGVQVGMSFSVGSAVNTGADWLIGAARFTDNTDSSYEFRGAYQNFGVYGAALNGQQIEEIYGIGEPRDISTGASGTNLLHWWMRGDLTSFTSWPSIPDMKGAQDGLIQFTPGIRLAEYSPVHVATAIDRLGQSGSDVTWMFDATDYDGTGDWPASEGAFTAVNEGSDPTRTETSQFSGFHEVTMDTLFRIPNDVLHSITAPTFTGTLIFRWYTGALNFSGGFFFGNAGGGFDSAVLYHLFYSEDIAFRIRKADDSDDVASIESHTSKHENSYVEAAITFNMPDEAIKLYVLGTRMPVFIGSLPSFNPCTNAAFGICGVAYNDSGGFAANGNGMKMMSVTLLNRVMTDFEIAEHAAKFNALKGYI